MTDFFNGIAWLFENILFYPLDALRTLQLDSWFLANILNWIFIIVGIVAFVFWMLQLKKYSDENDEDRYSSEHPYLG